VALPFPLHFDSIFQLLPVAMSDGYNNVPKAVLEPRRPGESLKVAQTVLKRRDRNLKAIAARVAQIAKYRKGLHDRTGPLNIISPNTIMNKALQRQRDDKRARRVKAGHCAKMKILRPNMKTIAVVRNGRNGGSRPVLNALKKMDLAKHNTLVFMPHTEDTLKEMQYVKPFVFWGNPTFKTVFNLIHKRASIKEPEKGPYHTTLLSDNALIEKYLGDVGVLCTEDLAHTIFERDKNFEKVLERVAPIPVDNAKKEGQMVNRKRFLIGNQRESFNPMIARLTGIE